MHRKVFFGLVMLAIGFCLLTSMFAKENEPLAPIGPYEFNYPVYFGNRINTTPENSTTKQGVYLGRMLFYEPKLSSNNQVACATCHQQERAFTDGKAFSLGVGKTPTTRSSMSLANLLWVRSFFWDGRAKSLEEQGIFPLTHPDEMGGTMENTVQKLQQTSLYPRLFQLAFGSNTITAERITKALAQFQRALISANSSYDRYLQGNYKPTESELRGINLFFGNGTMQGNSRGMNCGHCHGGPKTFTETFHNNGLDSVPQDLGREKLTGLTSDRGRFRVATLRNIALTAPYMHDGRFATLENVLDHYSDHIRQSASLSTFLQNTSPFSTQEKKDLLAFLQLLTDSSFIQDPRFSNPHTSFKR